MGHKSEHDWYQQILISAMKKINVQNEELHFLRYQLKNTMNYTTVKNDLLGISKGFQKPSFIAAISSTSIHNFRQAFFRSISETLNIVVEQAEHEGMVSFHLKPGYSLARENEISEEEITEKITEQLALVIMKSLIELRELRMNCRRRREKANEEFRKKLLEISNGVHGE